MERRLRYRLNREKRAETPGGPKSKVEDEKTAEAQPSDIASKVQKWETELSRVADEMNQHLVSTDQPEYDNLNYARQKLMETIDAMGDIVPE